MVGGVGFASGSSLGMFSPIRLPPILPPRKTYLPQWNHFAVALALANLCRVGDGTRCRAELRGVAAPSIPNLIVAGQAGDV